MKSLRLWWGWVFHSIFSHIISSHFILSSLTSFKLLGALFLPFPAQLHQSKANFWLHDQYSISKFLDQYSISNFLDQYSISNFFRSIFNIKNIDGDKDRGNTYEVQSWKRKPTALFCYFEFIFFALMFTAQKAGRSSWSFCASGTKMWKWDQNVKVGPTPSHAGSLNIF